MKLILLSMLLAFSAFANDPDCEQDRQKFCGGIEPGRGQLAKCLSDYEGQLSPKCSSKLKEFRKSVGEKQPCFEDLTEYCSDLPQDPHNFEYCLLKNETRLSAKCSAEFKKKKGNIIVRNPCAQDIANTCYKEVSGPEGGITRCLIRNKSKLSGFCQKSVDQKIANLRKQNPCFDDTEKHCPTQLKFIDIQDCLSKKLTSLAPSCQTLVKKENDKLKGNPCYRDLATHCRPGLAPKEQGECLALNEEHLSNACKQYRVVETNKVDKMVKLCEADRVKLCPKAPAKNGGIVKCLRQNKAQVSPACAALL